MRNAVARPLAGSTVTKYISESQGRSVSWPPMPS